MIQVTVRYNQHGDIWQVEILNHGSSIVCAGVSVLAMNTVNALERFTEDEMLCEYEEKGGYLKLELPDVQKGRPGHDAALLMNTLLLGLKNLAEEYYQKEIRIQELH